MYNSKKLDMQAQTVCQGNAGLLHTCLVNPKDWIYVIEDSGVGALTLSVDAPDMIHTATQ